MRIILIFLILFQACSKQKEITQQDKKELKTTIKENLSIVSAKVTDKTKNSDTEYFLKLLIIESTSDQNLLNFATQNDTILASPRFIYDETNQINLEDERNKDLLRLSYVKPGETVELKLTFVLNRGWLITDFIRKK